MFSSLLIKLVDATGALRKILKTNETLFLLVLFERIYDAQRISPCW